MAIEKTIKENLVYKGSIFDLYDNDIELINGKKSRRLLIKHNGAVCLIVEKDDNLVFVKQFRQGTQDDLLELVAGKLEKNEDPKNCAIRELEEETGYLVNNIIPFGSIVPVAAYSSEIIHCFIAQVDKKISQKLDPDEFLEIVEIPYEKVKKMYFNNEFIDGKTFAFLGKYILHRENKNK